MFDIEFLYDFGSPNVYMSWRVLPTIAADLGVSVRSIPILLGGVFRSTGNRSPAEAFADIKNKLEYEQLEMDRFVRRHGLQAYRHNPFFPINTLQLMRAAVAADHLQVGDAYRDRIFRGMWEDQINLGDETVLAGALAEVGLPVAEILEEARSPHVKAELIANTEAAVQRGVFGAPTFFVGPEMFFGKDRLRDLADSITATAAGD